MFQILLFIMQQSICIYMHVSVYTHVLYMHAVLKIIARVSFV